MAQTFDQRLNDAVKNYKSSSKVFVDLLLESVDQFWNNNSATKLGNLINALGGYEKIQSRIKALGQVFCPVSYEFLADQGHYKASDSESWANLKKAAKDSSDTVKQDKKKKELAEKTAAYALLIKKFKEAAPASVFENPFVNQTKYFKAVKASKVVDKQATTATNLIAMLLLSFPDMTIEDAKTKLTAAIVGVATSDIEEAKKEILKKTPRKPEEAPAQEPAPQPETV
ncbi:hypothetical protein D8V62_23790 [Salmonella enterica]|nr:hypothetical protein [Salmonella enterica]